MGPPGLAVSRQQKHVVLRHRCDMEERVGSTPSARPRAGSREGDEDDFYKLMDEHGIIGLGEPEEQEPVWEPEDQPSPDTLTLEDLSHRLRELMDSEPLSQSPKEDSRPRALRESFTQALPFMASPYYCASRWQCASSSYPPKEDAYPEFLE